jgi:hypothetical protein
MNYAIICELGKKKIVMKNINLIGGWKNDILSMIVKSWKKCFVFHGISLNVQE